MSFAALCELQDKRLWSKPFKVSYGNIGMLNEV